MSGYLKCNPSIIFRKTGKSFEKNNSEMIKRLAGYVPASLLTEEKK
jgi:hypothetical protein